MLPFHSRIDRGNHPRPFKLEYYCEVGKAIDGRGLSIASLAVAYPVLLLSLFLMSYSMVLVYQRSKNPEMEASQADLNDQDGFAIDSDTAAKARFQAAERSIMALQGDSPGRGNSPEAIRIAQSFLK